MRQQRQPFSGVTKNTTTTTKLSDKKLLSPAAAEVESFIWEVCVFCRQQLKCDPSKNIINVEELTPGCNSSLTCQGALALRKVEDLVESSSLGAVVAAAVLVPADSRRSGSADGSSTH